MASQKILPNLLSESLPPRADLLLEVSAASSRKSPQVTPTLPEPWFPDPPFLKRLGSKLNQPF